MKSPNGLDAKLPVADLLKEAFQIVWGKRVSLAKVFLPVIALLAVLDVAMDMLVDASGYSLKVSFILISMMLSVLMATTCHRYTLDGNTQDRSALRRWGRNESRYLMRLLQVVLITLVIFFALLMAAFVALDGNKQLTVLVGFIAAIPALYVMARFSITLPEIALGERTTLKRAWAMSEGNGMSLVLVIVIIPVVLMLPLAILFFFDHLVVMFLAALVSYVSTLVSLVLLSLSYRFLQEFYEPAVVVSISDESSNNSGFDA